MTFEEILDQAIAMLQRRGRLTYGALKRQFQLDDAYLGVCPRISASSPWRYSRLSVQIPAGFCLGYHLGLPRNDCFAA